jgi:L-ornithine Nalpha-acyltransferase
VIIERSQIDIASHVNLVSPIVCTKVEQVNVMQSFFKGYYGVRMATNRADVHAVQRLRHACFIGGEGRECDRYDALCRHIMVEDTTSGRLVGSLRLMNFANGTGISNSYSAQSYDLSGLSHHGGAMMEVGRFCVAADCDDPDILRIVWAALTRIVEAESIQLLFGCTTLGQAGASGYEDVFAFLYAHHRGPAHWLPGTNSTDAMRFDGVKGDSARGRRGLSPLIKTYLVMGGWVSDHAIVDRELNTVHVFTALEVASVRPERANLMRRMAG